MPISSFSKELSNAWGNHKSSFLHFKFVYPVISRRAKGISIGINVCPNRACNFNCPYCQIDRKSELSPEQKTYPQVYEVIQELCELFSEYKKHCFQEYFSNIPPEERQLKDIAISGDGEPTLYPYFEELCSELSKFQKEHDIPKLILITNSTRLQEKNVVSGLGYLCKYNGEIWGKLDAGSDEWLQQINGLPNNQSIKISDIEENLCVTSAKFPLRIQTMLCIIKTHSPNLLELERYANIVEKVFKTNPDNFLSVQLYSVVRRASDFSVLPLDIAFLEDVKEMLKKKIKDIKIGVFP